MKKAVLGVAGIVLFLAFIKFFLIVGALASFIALIYFTVQACRTTDNRNGILKTRILPSFITMIICFAMIGGLSNNSNHSSHREDTSSSKVEHHKASTSSSDDDLDDSSDSADSESDDVDDSSSDESIDTNDESESTDVSSNDENTTTNDNGSGNAPTNHGDMTTDQQGTIVGNSRTMIYHTPDQHGYRMNSANAVYFKSEADAQAAGYRKALK